MGNSQFKERIEKAAKTKMLTADNCKLDWDDVLKHCAVIEVCRVVSLAQNKLHKPVPPAFVSLKGFAENLRKLDLSKNGLHNVDAFTAGLDLHRALDPAYALELEAQRASIVPQLAVLESLDLSDNVIERLPPMFLAAMPKLKTLNVSGNKLVDPVPGDEAESAKLLAVTFCLADHLVTLDLSKNSLTMLPLMPRPDVPETAYLDGDRGLVSAACPLVRLEALDMSGNRIRHAKALLRDGGAPPLRRHLRSINLSNQGGVDGTVLQHVDPRLFKDPKLNDVCLDGNARKQALLEELRGASEYQEYVQRRAGTVNKQIAAGVDATLAD
jgi:hypothetical protein